FALLDKTDVVDIPHIQTALTVWRHCLKSVKYIFGESTGNRYADRLYEHLQEIYPQGMTMTQIANFFQRHSDKYREAVRTLKDTDLISITKISETGGRAIEMVYARKGAESQEMDNAA